MEKKEKVVCRGAWANDNFRNDRGSGNFNAFQKIIFLVIIFEVKKARPTVS